MGLRGAAGETGKAFDWEVTKRLGNYLVPHKRRVWLAMAAMLLSVLANITGPLLIGWAIDEGIRKSNLSLIGMGVLGYVGIQVLGLLGFRWQIMNMSTAGQRIIQTLRDELFTKIQNFSIAFFSDYETGRLIARVISDVNVLREAINFAVVGTMRDMLILVGILISMAFINMPLMLVALAALAVLVVIANFWRIFARKAYVRVREANANVNAELSEAFSGVRVTQAYDRQGHNYNRFTQDLNLNNRDANFQATTVAALFFPGIELVGGVTTGALIYVGGNLVLNENITAGVLVTFVLYIDQFFFPIRMLAQRYNVFQAVMAAGDKIFTLLDRPIDIEDAPDAIELPQIEGRVNFKNVHFSYNDDEDVLKGINLDIPAGSRVAFVGHTGAGKTTIIKLLTRFYDVDAGSLEIDGYDVRKVTQRSLRQQVGVVLQETHLFSGDVMENIRYGRLDATDEEVIAAAKAVDAHDFIVRLEDGYQTEIRESGALLSSGQRQLLSFARALLANPRILILDEATSSIDTQTEKIIQKALDNLLDGRTSFVIAHRLSTIVSSDLIVVMDHGKIIEKGTHHELLQLKGAYHNLYTMAYKRPLDTQQIFAGDLRPATSGD